MSEPTITVTYVVTPDERFRTMCAQSIYSLLRHNPAAPIRVTETDGGDYPIGIKAAGLDGRFGGAWVLLLDADTQVTGPLAALLPPPGIEFCARRETMYERGIIRHGVWAETCRAAGVPPVPVYNSGAVLMPSAVAPLVATEWRRWKTWLKANAEDPLEPAVAAARYPWWQLEQCALSLCLAGGQRREWTAAEHSFQWCSERPGILHHYSAKRWKPFLGDLP